MREILLKSLVISFIYVGVGTISLMGMYPGSLLEWDYSPLFFLLTLPVSLIGFGVLYTEKDSLTTILIIQFVTFFVSWFLLFLYLKYKQNKQNKQNKKRV